MFESSSLPQPYREAWSVAFRILQIQLLLTLAVTLLAALHSWQASYSALLGGVIGLLGQAYFTSRALRYSGARQARRIIRGFYSGSAGKWVITVVLFALAFKLVPDLYSWILFLTFGLTIVVALCAPVWSRYGQVSQKHP